MSYNAKLDWKADDDITESDVNRWEKGIFDNSIQLEQLQIDVSNLKVRVNTLEATLPDNFTHNQFNEDLTTLGSVKVIRGYYNEAQSRLEV